MSLSLLAMISMNGSGEVVDKVRLSLEASSAGWFRLVKYAGYAVALGCAMEAPETFVIIKRWFLLRFKGIELQETTDDKRSLIIPVAALGLILIVAGIVAETYFEGRVSDVDAELREHESDKITAAENDAASAIREAGNAKDSATEAAGAASLATGSATNAVNLATGARKEADSFETDIVSAKKEAADAESHLADALQRANDAEKESIRLRDILGGWQLDDEGRKRFTEEVQGFPGTPFDLAVNTDEASFMEELDGILTSPSVGWVRLPPKDTTGTGLTMLIDGKASVILTSGILLEVDQDQVDSLKPAITALGTALRDDLHLNTVNLHLVPPGSWGKRIHIIIGKRQ